MSDVQFRLRAVGKKKLGLLGHKAPAKEAEVQTPRQFCRNLEPPAPPPRYVARDATGAPGIGKSLADGRPLENTMRATHKETMRATITLDPDVVKLLRHAMRATQKAFKEALNDGLRRGLAPLAPADAGAPFVVKARPMGLRAGLDPSHLHHLADDLEAKAFVAATRKLRRVPAAR